MERVGVEAIEYVARLSRLELTAEEKERLVPQVLDIIRYVEKLNELDTSNIEPTAHILAIHNVTRADEQRRCLEQGVVLDLAPKQDGALVRVPRVIE